MPLGRVYIPPPTTPIKFGSEFSFPNPQHVGNNKFSNKFNHINSNADEEDDFLIRTNNLKNKLNNETTNCKKPLSFNYNVDINGAAEEDRPSSQNSGKGQAFRKIEIKILDTKYFDDNKDKNTTENESTICNGNASTEEDDECSISKCNNISTNDSTPKWEELDNSTEKDDNDEKLSSLSVNTHNNNINDHHSGLDLQNDSIEEGERNVSIETDCTGAKDNSIIQRGMNNHYLKEESCQDSNCSPQKKNQEFDNKSVKIKQNSFANNSKGLKNLGNTCFMNSIIQCLASTKPLLEFCLSFLDNQPNSASPNNTTFTGSSSSKALNAGPLAQTKMTKSFVGLLEDMWNLKNKSTSSSGSNHGIADPSNYRLSVTKFAPKFSGFDQHDSQEFLQYALEGFHTELNRVKKNDEKCNSKTSKDSLDDNATKDKNENIINDSSVVDSNCDSLNCDNDINNNENSTFNSQNSSTKEDKSNGTCDTLKTKDDENKKSKPRTYEEILDDPNISGEEKGRQCLDVYLSKDNSFITDLFLGQFRSTLQCCVCCHESITFEPFWLISVPIPSSKDWKGDVKRTIIDCMQEFTKTETLDGDEKPTCEKCKERRKCKKWYSVEKWPKILVIHLKRFAPGGSYRPKICCVVDVPLRNLNFSKFSSSSQHKRGVVDIEGKNLINGDCSSEEDDGINGYDDNIDDKTDEVVEKDDDNDNHKVLYDCYAISNHSGTLGGGHYTAYCRHPFKKATEDDGNEDYDNSNDTWHLYNDRTVSKSNAESVISGDAYLLFFEKL